MTTSAAFRTFEESLARFTNERELGEALHELTKSLVGTKLLTLTAINLPGLYVRRVYSSNETAYPLLGTKPLVLDDWFEQMRTERRISVVNTAKEMEADFPDIDLIRSLGCGSALNIPVMVGGDLLGTVNLLDEEHHYTPERYELAHDLIVPATALFLILRSRFEI